MNHGHSRGWAFPVLLVLASASPAQEGQKIVPAAPIQPATAGGAAAKGPSQQELVKLRDEKLALPVFQKAAWTFDYDVARERAKKEGKPIFTYFSRSYAH